MGGIEAFNLTIWTDIPAGAAAEYSMPGTPLWRLTTNQYNEVVYGTTQMGKTVTQYNVYLDPTQWFFQEQGKIYWLSIEAVFPDPMRQWGWHESKDHWNDAAVQDFKFSGWVAIQNNLYKNDMAFELTTIPEPGSLVALACGAIGMAGMAVRGRRRS